MLETVEVLPGDRHTLRRAVALEATLMSARWDEPRVHRVLDLSPDGIGLAAGTRLPLEDRVAVSFTPPGWWVLDELTLFAEVRRATPRVGARPARLGLAFLDLPQGAREQLDLAVRGLPPPLPRYRKQLEQVWVDGLVTWEEDLGDRVNRFEVSEALWPIYDGMLEPRALGDLLA